MGLAVLVVGVAAGAAAVLALGARDAGEEPVATVLTFNLCGNVCNHGGNESAAFVMSLARRTGATTLLLQEACRSQVEEIDRLLGSTSHYVTSFSGDAGGANQCPGDDYGIAVVSTEPIVERFTLPLPNPGLGDRQLDERRLVCIKTAITTCTTHLVREENDPVAHEAQVEALVDRAARLAEAGPTVIGGDLNARETAFGGLRAAYLSAPGSTAAIDRVFASRRHFRTGDGERHPCECSDHDALVVRLTARCSNARSRARLVSSRPPRRCRSSVDLR